MTKTLQEQIKDNLDTEQQEGLLTTAEDISEVIESEDTELSDFEQKVKKMGWNPKGSKSAAEWLYFGFEDRGRKLSDLGKAVDSLRELTTKQEQIALEKARREIQQEKRTAVSRGDVQTVERLEQQQEQIFLAQQIQSAANDFILRNSSWYNDTTDNTLKIRQACMFYDNVIAKQRLSPPKHFDEVEKKLSTEFPEYFGGEYIEKPKKSNSVEGGQSAVIRTSSKKSYSFDDLDDAQKSVCRRLERTKVMKPKEYIEMLLSNGDLK